MNVPSLKRMPSHSPSAGQSAGVAFVSGPRSVRKVLPLCLVTAISKWLAATERKSLRDRCDYAKPFQQKASLKAYRQR